jgi:DNA-binding transcriptional LysR family regulator
VVCLATQKQERPPVGEPIVVILPSDHPLAEHKAIDPHDLVGENFIGISNVPRVLRGVVGDYLERSGIEIVPHLEIDNFAMAVSLVASTRGVALLPVSAEHFLKWSVISRPLKGEAPTIDLVVGYHKANTSPILRTFLSRIDDPVRLAGDRPLRRDDGSAAQGSGELLLSHRIVSRQRGRAHVRGAGHSG